MAYKIHKIDYFYCSVVDQPGESYKLLSELEKSGIKLLAFTAIPIGPNRTQLQLFPDNSLKLISEAKKSNLILDGPHRAFLVQGDELSALKEIHHLFYTANINVYASNGVTDGKGMFGYLIFVRPEDFDRAVSVLNI
ncbi:MAG: hypothetical protein HND40_09560 [Ignavibacteriota bacterium]|jgi:hypothetical protein|nr:hypothetical protein [Ignavibacteriota bacterium]MBW7842346.1 hypothetical protein [Ignavibacterium sp.]MCO6446525.1 hypothetical protein [Ignavibacterium album]MCZ2269302.1 hypothetical protein [Ignavibacteriales bacterium]MDX9711095.1 hypothetical protein [Ignavibacteriaceae bacterium]